MRQIFETPTIADLAKYTTSLINNNVLELEEGEFELLPIQQWFFDHHNDIHHFNQAVWFIINQDPDFVKLERSINQVRANHGAFRLRFKKHDAKWLQYYQPEFSNLHLKIESTKLNTQQLIEAINRIHQSMNVISGPTDYIIWFNGYGLLWIIHHLIIDGVSWRILLDDLNAAYLNQPLSLKSNSCKDWSSYIQNYQNIDKVCAFYSKRNIQLLRNHTQSNNCRKEISVEFSNDLTEKFVKEANKCHDTGPNDLLLAALKLAIGNVTNDYGISIDLEGHGREKLEDNIIDLSTTVGWFTTIYPVTLQITDPNNLSNVIKTVKEHLREIPHNGLSYQIAVQRGRLKKQNSSILFNYLGQLDNEGTVFKFGNYAIGNGFSNNNSSRYMIEINGAIKKGILSFIWQYSTVIAEEQVIQILARFKSKFTEIILYCADPKNHVASFDVDLDDELTYIKELFN